MGKQITALTLIVCFGLFFNGGQLIAQTLPMEKELPLTDTLSNKNPDCVTPTPGMTITEDTTLCPGEYLFPHPVTSNFITIANDNVTLDCDNATLTTNSTSTIYPAVIAENYDNLEITNCNINNFHEPISITESDGSIISNSTFNKGSVRLEIFTNGQIFGLTKNPDTSYFPFLQLLNADYNEVYNNDIYGDGNLAHGLFRAQGILMLHSDHNTVHDNYFEANDESIKIGTDLSFDNEIYNNEFVNDIEKSVYLSSTLNNEVHNNIFSGNFIDILIDGSSHDNNIYTNQINQSVYNGIQMWQDVISWPYDYPYENYIYENIFTNGFRDIVVGPGVNRNIFTANQHFNPTERAILMWSDGTISNIQAEDNEFINNTIDGGEIGIELMYNSTLNAYFEGNLIKNQSQYGLYADYLNDNGVFLLNQFIDNAEQAFNNGTVFAFDNSEIGNYWNNYDEPLEGCDDTDQNGICDMFYSNIGGTGNIWDLKPIVGSPEISSISDQTINEGYLLELTVNVNDFNGDISSLNASYPNSDFGATFQDNGDNTGTFTWQPWFDQAGTDYDVIISAFDGTHTSEENFTITVNDYTVPPPTITLETSTAEVMAGQPFDLTVTASSEIQLASAWWGVREPGNYGYDVIPGSVDGNPVNLAPAQDFGICSGQTNCQYTRTVIIDEPGIYEVWANSRDVLYFQVLGEPHQASEGIGLAVVEMNVAPSFAALPSNLFTSTGRNLSFNVSATDPDGDNLNLEIIQSAPGASFTTGETVMKSDGTSSINGRFSWTPNFKQSGTYTIRFKITDELGNTLTSPEIYIYVKNLEIIRLK